MHFDGPTRQTGLAHSNAPRTQKGCSSSLSQSYKLDLKFTGVCLEMSSNDAAAAKFEPIVKVNIRLVERTEIE